MRGDKVMREIRRSVRRAAAEFDRIGGDLDRVRKALEEARSEESRQLAELARIRLDQLGADQVAGGLDAADQRALEILEERRAAAESLRKNILVSTEKLEESDQQRDGLRDARDQAVDRHDAKAQETLDRLKATEGWQFQATRVERATSQAAQASEKAKQAHEDRDRKRKPYERDKLFFYLWKRRFLFPEYRAWPLFRTLDGWVAGLCGYRQAHLDYRMLLEIPDRLRDHSERLFEVAGQETEALSRIEQEAYDADGLPALAAEVEKAQSALDEAEDHVAEQEALHEALLKQRLDMDSGQDPDSLEALQVLRQQIQQEEIATLEQDARRTGTSEDDALVTAIADLRSTQKTLSSDLKSLRDEEAQALDRLENVRDVARRFRSRGFDARESIFDADFSAGSVLAGILSGAYAASGAWTLFKRAQRFHRRSSTSGADIATSILGGLMSSSSSSGSSSFGGFSSGGGISSGGSGFSSGGGFGGGGGGFSSGGGF